ncbi:hydroxyacylglutathione hydrolase [Jannaschia pagri]|uniref:hydroxyacylglutathione hydrolase n=1 Tax=Jannaschia TaxID=188905 RepID=UPI003570E0FF
MPMLRDRFPDLLDNYGYIFRSGDHVACVDCARAAPHLETAADRGWTITDVLLTHHHPDHVDGVADLVAATGAKVWGHAQDAHRLPPLDHALHDGDTVTLGGVTGQIWDVSGHTIGHIAYIFDGIAFTGDSLMVGGCGRLFEGTAEQMHRSLGRFGTLPDETLIASGHEYTVTNLAFAATLEPDNKALISRLEATKRLVGAGTPSVPAPLSTERQTNPFLRAHVPAIKSATNTVGLDDVATFAAARRAKDAF